MQQDKFTVILSRTDSIGDVVLTLPMAGFIKRYFPGATIVFMGRSYTKAVIELSEHVNHFINYDDLEKQSTEEQCAEIRKYGANVFVHVFPVKKIAIVAKKCGIALRVGTRSRFYHWLACNKLVKLPRKNSSLHESQLNIKLLGFLGINTNVTYTEMPDYYGFTKLPQLPEKYVVLTQQKKYNIILHPKSKGSAKEWGANNFTELIKLLPCEKFGVFISGTEQDGELMRNFLQENDRATDLTGKLSLPEFIAFINACDALVAASTGPLHIAAALGKKAIGLFSAKRPIHPGRWKPVGTDAHHLVFNENCETCAAGKDCNCIQKISAQQVINLLSK